MESTKTSRGFLLAILLVVVVGLTALDIYQDRVIRKQQYELRWLATHSLIFPDAVAADAAKAASAAPPAAKNDSAKNDLAKPPATAVAVVPQSAKPAAPAHTAKP